MNLMHLKKKAAQKAKLPDGYSTSQWFMEFRDRYTGVKERHSIFNFGDNYELFAFLHSYLGYDFSNTEIAEEINPITKYADLKAYKAAGPEKILKDIDSIIENISIPNQ